MRWSKTLFTMLAGSLAVPALATATPPAGVVSNVIVAQGVTTGPIKERARAAGGWAVSFYDQDCAQRTYTAGQSFTEGADAHAAVNRGTGNARLLVAYIVKRGEPRRIEAPQPACGASLGIP